MNLKAKTDRLAHSVRQFGKTLNMLGDDALKARDLKVIGQHIQKIEDNIRQLSKFKARRCDKHMDIEFWRKP